MPVRSTRTSKYVEQYRKFFEPVSKLGVHYLIQQRSGELSKQKITYNNAEFAPEVVILFISHTDNWQIVNLLVSFSYFTFEIAVLNSNSISPFNSELKPIGSGAMGQVFAVNSSDASRYIIKSIQYTKRNQKNIPRN